VADIVAQGRWHKSHQWPVGRKSRRAQTVANIFGQTAPDLSRTGRVFSPVVRLKTSSGFATIFGGVVIPRNGSNPVRANAHKLATVWARRDFRPTGY
jgi:hypothetical protein